MTSDRPISIPAVCVRFQTDQEVAVTPYQIKGAIIRKFADHPLIPYINGSLRGQVRYPRIQVKVLRRQLCVFGLEDGYPAALSFRDQLQSLEVEGQSLRVEGQQTLESSLHFEVPEATFCRYKFITPWVALNRRILAQYTSLMPRERIQYLNRLLVQNLLFLGREFDLRIPHTVSVRVKLQSISPRVVEEQGSGSFKGYFTTNVQLPDYLGLGNSITKGLGTIVAI